MPDGMANNANGNVAAAAAAAAANGQRRDPSPELRQRGCWGKFWCLNPSRKGRIAPARPEGNGNSSNAWASNGASSSTAANQFVGLSPSLLAPPSSPASFANSGNPSTVQSPASFTVSLCLPTANVVCSPAFDSTATMFTIGPYAHETTLVTPPAFSAFTTAPSTAPFTPPPELAHFTTPSSPDVPFAQLLASSLKNAKGGGSSSSGPQPAAPYSASPFASPDYVSRNGDMQSSYQMYPESPLASLISPASGISESGPPSPLPELEFPAAIIANKSSLRRFRPSTSFSGLELPVKPLESSSIGNSANHSRELEPIRILSPPRGYRYDRHAPNSSESSSSVQNSSPKDSFKDDVQDEVTNAPPVHQSENEPDEERMVDVCQSSIEKAQAEAGISTSPEERCGSETRTALPESGVGDDVADRLQNGLPETAEKNREQTGMLPPDGEESNSLQVGHPESGAGRLQECAASGKQQHSSEESSRPNGDLAHLVTQPELKCD